MKRYIIRDKETGKVKYRSGKKMEFSNFEAAKSLYSDINYGLKHYYEIWDAKKNVLVFDACDGRGAKVKCVPSKRRNVILNGERYSI